MANFFSCLDLFDSCDVGRGELLASVKFGPSFEDTGKRLNTAIIIYLQTNIIAVCIKLTMFVIEKMGRFVYEGFDV